MSRQMINVHVFDTHLTKLYDSKSETHHDLQTKVKLFSTVRNQLKRERAKHMLDVIMNDMKHNTGTSTKNYDPSNKVNCTDVLAAILTKKDNSFIIPLLDEQLEDMYNLGQCPQGRSTRLLQLYILF